MKKILLLLVSLTFASCNLSIEIPEDPNPQGQYFPPTYNYNALGCGCGEVLSVIYIQNAGYIANVELENVCTGNIVVFQLSTSVLGQGDPGCSGYVCLGTTW
jgi:hypothetical protein